MSLLDKLSINVGLCDLTKEDILHLKYVKLFLWAIEKKEGWGVFDGIWREGKILDVDLSDSDGVSYLVSNGCDGTIWCDDFQLENPTIHKGDNKP